MYEQQKQGVHVTKQGVQLTSQAGCTASHHLFVSFITRTFWFVTRTSHFAVRTFYYPFQGKRRGVRKSYFIELNCANVRGTQKFVIFNFRKFLFRFQFILFFNSIHFVFNCSRRAKAWAKAKK